MDLEKQAVFEKADKEGIIHFTHRGILVMGY